jgi:mannitol/fructose-specific phosphotransferase system IIA component (Ntr-type)
MNQFSEILLPSHVNLALTSKGQAEGVSEVLSKLNGDPRITDWDGLTRAITARNAPAISCGACGICIAHGRTDAVHSLIMAAGRSTEGLPSPDVKEPVRLIFVAGIPAAFHSEYLRVVGAIARLCQDKNLLNELLALPDAEAFVALLSSAATKL